MAKFYYKTRKAKKVNHKENEDSFLVTENTFFNDCKMTFLIVCDGMGGYANGKETSANAVKFLIEEIYTRIAAKYTQAENVTRFSIKSHIDELKNILKESIIATNEKVIDCNEVGVKSGTTLSVVCMVDDYAVVANIGDSPVYLYKKDEDDIELVSELQTQAELDYKNGKYERYSAAYYANEHIITKSIGIYRNITDEDIYINEVGKLNKGDTIIIGSDGAFGRMYEPELKEVLENVNEVSLLNMFNNSTLDKDDDQTAIICVIE